MLAFVCVLRASAAKILATFVRITAMRQPVQPWSHRTAPAIPCAGRLPVLNDFTPISTNLPA
jgi:hypothetical protein